MTTLMNEDRFSFLFDVASGNQDVSMEALSDTDQHEVERIRTLLHMIDAAWEVAPSELDIVRAQFLTKLATREPDHPWVAQSTVNTLGDLVRVSGEDVPALPESVYAGLLSDATLVADLMNPSERTKKVGIAVRAARVPQEYVMDFVLWVNQSMTALFPLGGTQNRYVFTRKQRGSGRGPR